MQIVYINKKHQCRKAVFDDLNNRIWVDPNFREKFLEKRRVGFDLNQLDSITEMPELAEKVSSSSPLVYLLIVFKDKRQVPLGVDKDGLYAVTAALKAADQRNDGVSNSLIYAAL